MTEKQIDILYECSGVLKIIANIIWTDIPKCHKDTLHDVINRINDVLDEEKIEKNKKPYMPK